MIIPGPGERKQLFQDQQPRVGKGRRMGHKSWRGMYIRFHVIHENMVALIGKGGIGGSCDLSYSREMV